MRPVCPKHAVATTVLCIVGLISAAPRTVRAQTATAEPPLPAPARSPTPAQQSDRSRKRVVVDRIIAIVDEAILLESELARRALPLVANLNEISDPRERERRRNALGNQLLEDMINEQLVLSAARGAKLEVTTKEVDNAVEEIKQQNNVDDQGLNEALAQQGYTMSAYRKDVTKQILRMRALNVIVRPRVTVTDDDVRTEYGAQSRRAGAVTEVQLQHVLIALPPTPTQQQLAEARRKASTVIERQRAGDSFDALAKEMSDDAATAAGGGTLGWIQRGTIATEWETIVFGMEPGEVRGPISGPSGLHVFHVTDVKKAEHKPFEEAKESIRNDLYRRAMDKQTAQWVSELRKKAYIDVKL